MDRKVKRTLKLLIIGMAIYTLFLFVVSLVILIIYCYNHKVVATLSFIIKAECGCILGFIVGGLGVYNMAITLTKAIDSKDEKFTRAYVSKYSMIRLLMFCIILGVIISDYGLGLPAGIMFALATFGIKIGTYLVPILDKRIGG